MRFVYATRPLPKLEFATADQREAIPAEAEVFAVCDGALTIRRQNASSAGSLTDLEQSTLDQLIRESQETEAAHSDPNAHTGFVRRLIVRLLNL